MKKGSTELQIFFDILQNVSQSPATQVALPVVIVANLPGIKDFLKSFGSTCGQQLFLKLFAKGNNLRESEPFMKNGKIFVRAINSKGQSRETPKEELDFYRKSNHTLNEVYQLKPGEEDSTEIGSVINGITEKYGEFSTTDKDSFTSEDILNDLDRRIQEDFDEDLAEETRIIGQFIDFYGLGIKYKFAFQARKEQDKIGKQKILCIIDDEKITEILDLLKPANRKNICIHGKAVKDAFGKIDKIKIDWFNENPSFNPNQLQLQSN